MAVYSLHENVVTSRHDHREMPWGCGLENCAVTSPFPEKPQSTIRAKYVMDCSALKLGQKNIYIVGKYDITCFFAQGVLSFSTNNIGLRRSRCNGSFRSRLIFWASQNAHVCLGTATVASPWYRYLVSGFPTNFLRSGLDLSRLGP